MFWTATGLSQPIVFYTVTVKQNNDYSCYMKAELHNIEEPINFWSVIKPL